MLIRFDIIAFFSVFRTAYVFSTSAHLCDSCAICCVVKIKSGVVQVLHAETDNIEVFEQVVYCLYQNSFQLTVVKENLSYYSGQSQRTLTVQ